MRYFRQYRPLQLLLRRLVTLLLFLAAILVANGVWGVFQKEQETRANREEAEEKRAELAAREYELRVALSKLKSDSGIEAQLRQQFEVARKGEGLIIIVEEPVSVESEPEKPFWRQWAEFIRRF